MMTLEIISAEAIIRSKRSNYRSPLDSDANELINNSKQFLADPEFVRAATMEFKNLGFKISSIGKFSLGVLGTKALFETTFNVKLIKSQEDQKGSYEVDSSPAPFVISTLGSPLESTTDSLLLTIMNLPTELIPFSVTLSDIHKIMAFPREVLFKDSSGPKIRQKGNKEDPVIVIEDGCYTGHKDFQAAKKDLNISISPTNSRNIEEVIAEIHSNWIQRIEATDTIQKEFDDYYKDVSNGPKPDITQTQSYQTSVAEGRRLQNEYENYVRYWDSIDSDTPDGHGTAVVGSLITTMPTDSTITVLRHLVSDGRTNILDVFKQVSQLKSSIVNCSFSLYKSPAQINKKLMGPFLLILGAMRDKKLFVFSSGNNLYGQQSIINEISLYSQLPIYNILIVGGCFYSSEPIGTNPNLYASDAAHGFKKDTLPGVQQPSPHVCGICGPKRVIPDSNPPEDLPYIKTPNAQSAESDYSVRNGTSFAAPQVSGICASIKAACPSATPMEIKEIILHTATRIERGKTAQGVSLSEIDIEIGNDIFNPGLANLELANLTALKYSAYVASQNGLSIQDAANFVLNNYL